MRTDLGHTDCTADMMDACNNALCKSHGRATHQPNLQITYEYAEPPSFPRINITVDGKQVFAESVVIEMTTAGTKAVITVYDLGLTFNGPAAVVHKTKNDEGEWV